VEDSACVPHPGNGALCLGSPTRQRLAMIDSPTLPTFVRRCNHPLSLRLLRLREAWGRCRLGNSTTALGGIRQDFASLFGVDERNGGRRSGSARLPEETGCQQVSVPVRERTPSRSMPPSAGERLRDRLGRSWFREQHQWLTGVEAPEELTGRGMRPPLPSRGPVRNAATASAMEVSSGPRIVNTLEKPREHSFFTDAASAEDAARREERPPHYLQNVATSPCPRRPNTRGR